MTITNEERESVLKYRLEQAHEMVEEARFLIDNNKLKTAVNRIYYGMFYILCGLALKYQFYTSKHHQLIGWFNKTFIKEKIIDQKYGDIIRKSFSKRSDSDYGVMVKFEKIDVEKMLEDMKEFIAVIERLIFD